MPLILKKGKFLINPIELESLDKDLEALIDSQSAKSILNWARQYLSKSNPNLGRKGPVCPFVEPSITKNNFWITINETSGNNEKLIHDLVIHFRNWYLELQPLEGPESLTKTILILFPNIKKLNFHNIDKVQKRLKPHFIKKGLMIGQFYDGCQEPGLWNPNFHPLQSPIPLLAIRKMVPSDFPFLKDDTRQLLYYLKAFGKELPLNIKKLIIQSINL